MLDRIIRSNHVGFTVAGMDRAIDMFTTLFGYDLVSRAGRNPDGVARLTGVPGADVIVAHLRKDGLIGVELIEYLKPDARGRNAAVACDTGYAHLTYDVRDLDGLVAEAAAFGLVPVGRKTHGAGGPRKGISVIYLRDPDGINIELIQPAIEDQ